MAWSTIRKATDEDYEKLEQRAEAFLKRHNLDIDWYAQEGQSKAVALEDILNYDIEHGIPSEARYLLGLWKRIVKRALGHHWAEGIAYGYVGFSVD